VFLANYLAVVFELQALLL